MTIYDRIATIIREMPEAASNYNLLLALYWCSENKVELTPTQIKGIAQASNAESISRIYRIVKGDNIHEIREGVQTWMKEELR